VKPVVSTLLPTNSHRRKFVKRILVKLGLKNSVIAGYYNTWMYQQLENMQLQFIEDIKNGPLVSIVVPTYNTPKRYLDELIYSIISQSYSNWELVLVNGSTDVSIRETVKDYAQHDKRIKVIDIVNHGISSSTNAGLKVASGSYIAFCDHDDVIEPFALSKIVQRIVEEGAELIYTDEDKISDDSTIYFDPHFKPDWSPDLFTNVNYINHLTVVKKELVDKAGLLDPDFDGAQDYNLLLRIIDMGPKISHVPEVLYHWRAVPNSTAFNFSSKKNILNAAQLALEEHFNRINIKVRVLAKDNQPGFYKLGFELPQRASLIILPFASDSLLRLYTETLLSKTDLTKTEIQLIVPDGVQPRFDNKNIKVSGLSVGEDYLNRAINEASNKDSVIISQIVLPMSPDWLSELCGPLNLSHVGAVAPLIVRDGSIIEDAGLVRTGGNELSMLFRDQSAFGNQTFFGNTNWTRNVDALSGAATAVRTKDLLKFMKLDTRVAINVMADFSLYIRDEGKYNMVFTEVMLDNYSIRIQPMSVRDREMFFSPNLILIGKDYEIYTPESAATNILLKLNESN
jgi:glycosyltransferase involved in cell wall biosynthesis